MKPVVKGNWVGCMPVNMLGTSVLLLALCGAAAAPAHAQPMVNYMKSNTGAPLCLAVMNGQIANNSPLITWDCISGDPSQQFYLSNNMFHIGSKTGNYCMASYDNPAHAGSRVGVWQCQTGDATQRFNVGARADIDGPNGLCVGVTNGSNVRGSAIILWNCQNATASITVPNQAWQPGQVVAAAPAPAPAVPQLAYSTAPTTTTFSYGGRALSANLTILNGYLISQDGGGIVAAHMDQNGLLVGSNGVALTIDFISHNGSAIVAAGGGNIVAAGGGNIVAAGGGNLTVLARTVGGMCLYDKAAISTALQRISAAALATSQQQLAQKALSAQPPKAISVISTNGSNIMVNNGANYTTLAVPATPAQPPARLQLTITGPVTFANNVANTIAWQYIGTPAAGQSTVNIYLVVNGSRYQLAANVPITARQAVAAPSNFSLVVSDANGAPLAQVPVTVR